METPAQPAVPLNELSRAEVYRHPPLTVEQVRALPASFGLEFAARAWGIGESTAMKGAKAGTLPFRVIKLGGRGYTVRRSDLMQSLGIPEAGEVPVAQPGQAASADPAA